MNIKVALIGASGRTGRFVLDAISNSSNFQLTAAIVSPKSSVLNLQVPQSGEIAFTSDMESAISKANVVIDFSTPQSSVEVARACANCSVPCLIATTGHTEVQSKEIQSAAQKTPILVAPNTSIGVFVVSELVGKAAELLGERFEVEIMESHHRGKKDAPSGTAKALAAAILEKRDLKPITHREGQRSEQELGIVSIRGGDTPGDHTIYFFGEGERIEISHKVTNRSVFAAGALVLAERLLTKKPGLWRVRDIFI